MTQYRRDPGDISNYFDQLFSGIGKRGSSFMDIDGVAHDKDTDRFLFMEFKQPGEYLHPATRMVLDRLAPLPHCTVWCLRRLDSGRIGFGQFRSGRREEIITETEARRRFTCWWKNEDYAPPTQRSGGAPPSAPCNEMLTAADLKW